MERMVSARPIVALGVSLVVMLAGCTSSQPSGSHASAQADRLRCPDGHYARRPGIFPARIFEDPDPVGGGQPPAVNEWAAGSNRSETRVWAFGSKRTDLGAFSIWRLGTCDRLPRDSVSVKVPGAGPLKIVKAPLGRAVVGWAQRRGNLRFTSANGITGTLHLKDDTVTLHP
jgi:hypothetical protein